MAFHASTADMNCPFFNVFTLAGGGKALSSSLSSACSSASDSSLVLHKEGDCVSGCLLKSRLSCCSDC